MTPVRVLHVHTLPVISGSGINTFLSMCGQQAAGFDVALACAPGGALVELAERHGLRVHAIQHFRQPLHPWHDLLALSELWRLCRRERYTIVHTHNSKAGFLGRLAARLAGVPIIIHTVHGFAFHDQEPWWRRQLFIWLERLAARWCDQLVMISQPLIDWAVAVRVAPRDRMVRIYSGIDVSAFQQPVDVAALRRALGYAPQDLVVGEVAKLWPGKGHDVLLRALAEVRRQVPTARLLLVGEGSEQAALERLAQQLELSDVVRFLGFRADVAAVTHAFDVAVLPSLFEGMGRAVLEAMACAKPVVASRVGGIVELVEDGVTGLLVPSGDVAALADALRRLLQDAELRARMGQAGRARVTDRFDLATMNRELVALYRVWLQRTSLA